MKKFRILMNRKFVAIFGALLFLFVGVTIAFNSDSVLFQNIFHLAVTKTSVIETFVAPTNWLPCQTTDKVITVRNDGNVPVAARIKIAERWKDKDGNELALTFIDTNGATQRLALININTADWEKRGAYYYYKTDLAPGETSTPFMTDVTLNCAANLVDTPYLGGTYTLSATIQTIEAEHQNAWSTNAVLDSGVVVNAKLKTLAGTTPDADKPWNTSDYNIKSIQYATSLPVGFDVTNPANIISAEGSEPIYAWFDNTNNSGIIYIYSNSRTIKTGSEARRMFSYIRALTSAPALSDWDTSGTLDMAGMFNYATSLTSINLSDWDMSNVTDMSAMFQHAESLTTLDISNWDTSNVKGMGYLFNHDYSLITIDLSNWDTSNVTNMGYMFNHDSSLTTVNLSNWDTPKVTTTRAMFGGCSSLALLDVSGWDTSNVTDMSFMFSGCSSLALLDVSSWDTSNVTNMDGMFSVGESYVGNGQLTEIIGLENFDTSNVTNMTEMFYGAGQMTHYNISGWNVSKVESFNHMFCDNFKLESLDLSHWDVSNVKTMYDMFDDAKALTTLGDISHWNTASLIDAGGFLNGATSFVGDNGTLDLSGWNTSNLLAAGEMFRAAPLIAINLKGWNFNKLTNDSWEGAGVSPGIYYETGNTSSYPGLSGMFLNMPNLQNVYIDQDGKDSFDAAVARGVNVDKFWQGSPISDFTVLSN